MIRTAPNLAPPPAMPPRNIAAEMADAMRRLAFSGATVDSSALELEGFSRADIAAHGEAARGIAARDAIRRVEVA